MEDLTVNLTDGQWRVRKSCCHALAELLRSSAPINLTDKAPELWKQLFRVMDDIHEATRLAAANTAKIFSHVSLKLFFLSKNLEFKQINFKIKQI